MQEEIAEQLECGMVCFYCVKNGELEYYPEEAEENDDDENAWQDVIDKIEEAPYGEYLKFPKMDSDTGYRVMEDFVSGIEDEGTRRVFKDALSKRKPFQQFRHLIQDYPQLLDDWHDYKSQSYLDHVQQIIDDYNADKEDK